MLTHTHSICTETVAELLDQPSLRIGFRRPPPSDRDFLAVVCECARTDRDLAADLAAIVESDDSVVIKFERETVDELREIPARLSVYRLICDGRTMRPINASVRPVVVPQTRAQVLAYAIALLIDADLPYGRDLRRCKLDGCGTFFLVERQDIKGRARERYCSEQHMRAAQKATASARVMASRAGLTLEEFEKRRAKGRDRKAKQARKPK